MNVLYTFNLGFIFHGITTSYTQSCNISFGLDCQSYKRSRPEVFSKKRVIRNLAKFTGKRLSYSYKSQPFNFFKKETLAQVLSCQFCEISKNSFLHRTHLLAASCFTISVISRIQTKKMSKSYKNKWVLKIQNLNWEKSFGSLKWQIYYYRNYMYQYSLPTENGSFDENIQSKSTLTNLSDGQWNVGWHWE